MKLEDATKIAAFEDVCLKPKFAGKTDPDKPNGCKIDKAEKELE